MVTCVVTVRKFADIHRRMKRQMETGSYRASADLRMAQEFKSGVSNLAGAAHSYRPHNANSSDANAEVERMLGGGGSVC